MNFIFKFFEWLFSEEPIEELEVTTDVPKKEEEESTLDESIESLD